MSNSKKGVLSFFRRKAKPKSGSPEIIQPYTPLAFADIQARANELADHIERHFEELAHILLEYESYEVVVDETERTLDILRNLSENEDYFKLRIGAVTTFLPRNQPLYALTCFVLVPSFMASEVHFRIPHSMRHFFPKLLTLLNIYEWFPNVSVSHLTRSEFITERTALRVNPGTKESVPVTDAVIFTGTPTHADQLRMAFDQRTLFITNGSGHNPVVIAEDADVEQATEAVLTLQLYNQGQDCAAPSTILVHKKIFNEFLRTIRDEIRTVRVGDYRDRKCRVGPISDPKDLVRVQDFLIDNREWLDPTTPGVIRSAEAILEPTLIVKPLKEGGNYSEIFAPVIFIQRYEKDSELASYFEDARYALNAMYVTLYGSSTYVHSLIGKEINGKLLHDEGRFLHNTHLHMHGAERGTQPYGGYGYGASNFSIDGEIICTPTLPQRDIYEQIAKPLLAGNLYEERRESLARFTEIHHKNVQKILRTKQIQPVEHGTLSLTRNVFVDTQAFNANNNRYVEISSEELFQLLDHPNTAYIATLDVADLEQVRELRALISSGTEDFPTGLYTIAAAGETDEERRKERQLRFFRHVYQLLFGKGSGPRLGSFLPEVDQEKVCALLDV
ncbi:MAG: aldehyde dehydrogenase family protein [Patescibacteria group bacterium]